MRISRRNKTGPIILSATVALIIGAYLMTSGHYFLPLPHRINSESKALETWEFSSFVIPSDIDIWYRVKYPARVRMIELMASSTNATLKEIFEELNYPFPPGCFASAGDRGGGIRITHYPSILKRIQTDFQLPPTYKFPSDTSK